MLAHKELSANCIVKVIQPGAPPTDIEWVRDVHVNPRTRRQLIEGFWKGHRGISGQVAYVANESERDRLRRQGKVLIHLRDVSAQKVSIIVPAALLRGS